MKNIYKNIYVGNQKDYEENKNSKDFAFINACKEPYHRIALGYSGRSCDKNNEEYLFAYRDDNNRLICNLVDVPLIDYISPIIIDECMKFIYSKTLERKNILINCNLGESRSPIIAMLYLATINYFNEKSFEESEKEFKKIYKEYKPAKGVYDYAKINWNKYINKGNK